MSEPNDPLEPIEERSPAGVLRRLFAAAIDTRPRALSCTLCFRDFNEVQAFGQAVGDLTAAGDGPRMTLVLREDSVLCTFADGVPEPEPDAEAAELSGRRHDPHLLERARQRLESVASALSRQSSGSAVPEIARG